MSKGRSKRMTKKEFDEQFEAFLKESASSEESLDSSRINKFLEKPKREGKPWWLDDEDDDDVKVGTGKSFLKKKSSDSQADKPEQTFSKEKDEKPGKADRQKNKQQGKSRTKPDVSISRDSLEDISEKSEEDFADRPRVHVPGLNLDNSTKDSQDISMTGLPQKLGMDTLDELADKEKFFKDLERNAHGTIDYNRLNQELSVTGTTMSPDGAAKTAATLAVLKDVEDDELDEYERPGAPEPPPLSEARSNSEQKPSMLSKVSLMDSLESTMNTTTSPQVGRDTLQGAKSLGITMEEKGDEVDAPFTQSAPETFKTGTGFIGTNTSQEIEALHKALREVGMSTTLKNESLFELSEEKDTADLVQKLLSGEIGNKTGKQRPLDEILKELEVLQKKARDDERKQADVDLPSRRQSDPRSPRIERQAPIALPEELRGFALSPVQQDSPGGGFDYSHTEDTEMYQPVTQVSVTEKNKGKKNTARDEKSHKEKTDKSEKSKDAKGQHFRSPRSRDSKLRQSLSPRSRSTSPRKPDIHPVNETMKNKYSNIKSSGYGVTSPSKVVREGLVTKQKSLKMTKNRSASKSPRRMHDPKKSQWRVTSETDLKNEEEAVKDGEDTDAQALSELEKVKKADDTAKSAKTAGKPVEKTGKTWSPAEITRQKVQGTHSPKQKRKEGVLILDSQLQASVDSFAHYIKNHFTGDNVPQVKYSVEEPSLSASWKHKDVDLDLVRDWQERWKQENQAKLQVEAELMMAHREFEKKLEAMRLESDQEIFKLKQDNFVLNAKVEVSEQDSVKKKVLNGETLEGVNKDQMALLEKELKEQETLLAGYQQENKRLYDEMKNIKKQSKQTEERMFKENQKLLSEITSLRTELEKKAEEMRDKVVTTGLDAQQKIAVGDARFAGVDLVVKLEAELRETKISMNNLKREMNILVQSKVELEKHIEKLVTEREELEKKLKEAKTMKSEEATDLEKKYEEEIGKLKKKLKWYMENQELLDEGAKNLRLKGDEIQRLKLRIEELQTETGKRMEESKIRARERAADAKKIQDLQRQVKEMEQILKKRNPNALPTLIMAAAAAAAASEPNIANKTPYVDVLEKRVKKLEAELDAKDGEADQLLRGVEQRYNSIKFQYEERIKELELQLSIYQGQTEHTHPHTHAIALERELENVRERYKKQVAELQAEVDRLNTDVTKSRKNIETTLKSELQAAKETESELHSHIKSLQVEVESKQHDLEVMQKSLERLRKEKHSYMMNGVANGESSRIPKAGVQSKKEEIPQNNKFHSLPPEKPKGNDREYEPSTFADAHISDILQENEELRTKVDQLQLQLDQQRVEMRKSLAETEAVARMSREEYEEQIQSLKAYHQKELQKILAEHALKQASSKTAELQSKADTQEVMIRHLKEQLAKAEVELEQVAVLRIRQATLEMQLMKCEEELREAKKCHTPEMRHFEALQGKITQIEKKHEYREQELQQVIKNAQHAAKADLDQEVQKWKKIVEVKNNEIQKFRMELDSILEVLRVLQKQGVIIPIGPEVS